jgi:hypothetical protein
MANKRYENFVLENKLKDQLETKLSMLDYVTVDDSLVESAGMTKKVNVYKASGAAQDVAEGEGNTESIEMSYTPAEYKVGTTQARFVYTDEDAMTDPYVVEAGTSKLAESLVNAMSKKVNDEYWHATEYISASSIDFSTFVDAIAKFNKEGDNELSLFALCNPSMKAALRKALKDDLKYVEDFTRTGYIGHVAGVPIIGDKLVPDNSVIIATKEAVTYFRKKNVETEQDRDQNTRKNILYGRQVGVVAFTDATQCVIIAPAGTAPVISTSSISAGTNKAIAGTCISGARVGIFVNDVQVGEATVSGTAWNFTIPSVATGDNVKAVAYVKGFAGAEATKTVV